MSLEGSKYNIECLQWLYSLTFFFVCSQRFRGKKNYFLHKFADEFLDCTKLKTFWLSAFAFMFTYWFLLLVGKFIYCHKPVKGMCIFDL